MNAVLIGSGNVATILGRKIIASGNNVLQVISKNIDHAKTLAMELHSSYDDIHTPIHKDADIVIIAISDYSLISVGTWLKTNNKLTVHTAGSVDKNVLQHVSSKYGSMYPFQSLHKNMQHLPEIPFLINGCNDDVAKELEEIVKILQSPYTFVTDEDKMKYHASGVVVNNFPTHIYALIENFCINNNLEYKVLAPLILETANRGVYYHPHEVQTGPALRNDTFILEKHLKVFQEYPGLRTLYIRMTDSIIDFYAKLKKANNQ